MRLIIAGGEPGMTTRTYLKISERRQDTALTHPCVRGIRPSTAKKAIMNEKPEFTRLVNEDFEFIISGALRVNAVPPGTAILSLNRDHFDGFVYVNGNQARHAGFLHCHTDELMGHFHGDLVVGDEQELDTL